MKTLIVSLVRPRDGQGVLLSCCGQLKITNIQFQGNVFWYILEWGIKQIKTLRLFEKMPKNGPKMAKKNPWGCKLPENGKFFIFCSLYFFSPIAQTFRGSAKSWNFLMLGIFFFLADNTLAWCVLHFHFCISKKIKIKSDK